MNRAVVQLIKEFMDARLEGYRTLMDLNHQLKEVIDRNDFDEVMELLSTKNNQIAQVNRLQEGLKNDLQMTYPGLRLDQAGWNHLFSSLSVEAKQELNPLIQATQKILLQIQEQEALLKEKVQVCKVQLSKKMQETKLNKKAHKAYEHYGNTAIFVDKQR